MFLRCTIVLFLFPLLSFPLWAQDSTETPRKELTSVAINWVKRLSGDFPFTNNWSYPLGVERKADGRAGCADGGFCPERCYSMMDTNGIVLKDCTAIFYKLLDTTHQVHTIQCEAWCYEWAGTDFILVERTSKENVFCHTPFGVATHSSFSLSFFRDTCYSFNYLKSIVKNADAIYRCSGGYINIDRKSWRKGFLKAEFSLLYDNYDEPKKPMFWKGRIYAKIKT